MNLSMLKFNFNKIKLLVLGHKIISAIIVLVLVAGIVWVVLSLGKTTGQTKYVLAKVEKGTIISSLSSSGQVSALNSIDIKAKASGDIVYVGVKEGDVVRAGQLLVQLDDTDAQKAVRNAQINLDKAQLALEKMQVSNVFLTMPSTISGLHDLIFTSTTNSQLQPNIDWYLGQISSANPAEDYTKYRNQVVDAYNLANDAYNKM